MDKDVVSLQEEVNELKKQLAEATSQRDSYQEIAEQQNKIIEKVIDPLGRRIVRRTFRFTVELTVFIILTFMCQVLLHLYAMTCL